MVSIRLKYCFYAYFYTYYNILFDVILYREEWGNPNEEKYYDYMETYSPYDNVKAQNYPAILVNAGRCYSISYCCCCCCFHGYLRALYDSCTYITYYIQCIIVQLILIYLLYIKYHTGLNDPRVAYWEPAKWVAKLREYKTDSNPLLLKTDMGSGHFSASDRYKYIRETAFEYAFILDQIVNKD